MTLIHLSELNIVKLYNFIQNQENRTRSKLLKVYGLSYNIILLLLSIAY